MRIHVLSSRLIKTGPTPRRRLLGVGWLTVLLLSLVAAALAGSSSPSLAAEDFGQPEPGRRVYDRAGILTTAEVERLEDAAAMTTDAGAPTIVFLRRHDADAAETIDDAAELMEAWSVESAPDAQDGLVIVLNVDPDDSGSFDVGLWAGATHADGNLPERALERIVDEEILPPLREDQVAAALIAGLDAAAVDLRFGPPPPPEPSELEQNAASFARWPMAVLGWAGAAVVGWITWTAVRSHPAGHPPRVSPTLQVPGDLRPALAGALVAGRVGNEHHVATILDFAGRGALAFEPAASGKKSDVQLLLVDDSLVQSGYEQAVWTALSDRAEGEVVGPKAIGKLHGRFGPATESLRAVMAARGWWDRAILERRRPLIVGGLLALVIAAVGLVAMVIGEEPRGLIGVIPLATAGAVALAYAAGYPPTTAAGQAQATPWRALKSGLKAARRDQAATMDIDAALPYAVALGASGALDKRLKAASAEGRVPLAFRQGLQGDAWAGGFYPYWAAFSVLSGASGNAAGVPGAGAGGAAAGGAGAGGSA